MNMALRCPELAQTQTKPWARGSPPTTRSPGSQQRGPPPASTRTTTKKLKRTSQSFVAPHRRSIMTSHPILTQLSCLPRRTTRFSTTSIPQPPRRASWRPIANWRGQRLPSSASAQQAGTCLTSLRRHRSQRFTFLIDDVFLNHNAFRCPGAPSLDDLEQEADESRLPRPVFIPACGKRLSVTTASSMKSMSSS